MVFKCSDSVTAIQLVALLKQHEGLIYTMFYSQAYSWFAMTSSKI